MKVHLVLVDRLGGLNLSRNSVVGLYDRPDMTVAIYRGRKATNNKRTTNNNQSQYKEENSSVILDKSPASTRSTLFENSTIFVLAF